MALAHSYTDRVSVFSLAGGLASSAMPVCVIEGPESELDYPHDVDFSRDGRFLAVANRTEPALTIYRRKRGGVGQFAQSPWSTVRGADSELEHTDGVWFVPPRGRYLAAVNASRSSITFYKSRRGGRKRFDQAPAFVLEGPATELDYPDGMAFSSDGALLAVANHTSGSATVYQRGRGRQLYDDKPVAILSATPPMRYPHSVAFSPDGRYLAASSAGGRQVSMFHRSSESLSWVHEPALDLEVYDQKTFDERNRLNPQEGGPKGLAFGAGCFAVCSEKLGLHVYRSAQAH